MGGQAFAMEHCPSQGENRGPHREDKRKVQYPMHALMPVVR